MGKWKDRGKIVVSPIRWRSREEWSMIEAQTLSPEEEEEFRQIRSGEKTVSLEELIEQELTRAKSMEAMLESFEEEEVERELEERKTAVIKSIDSIAEFFDEDDSKKD